MEQQYRQGDRVEWRDQQNNQKRQGTIQQVQGSGQNARYTIRDDQNQQQQEVQHNRIERKLHLLLCRFAMDHEEQCRVNDRVEWRDDNNQKHTGVIVGVDGIGLHASYKVLNEKTQQEEQCHHHQVERKLQ
ncbi:uncharacterized protein VTP21DRAFT_11702 [Calcarisporiella thermophila]|uniref:uncharacterized protein n=1 Tax=Calcarisporiella thermophila TaxID=911321 RepID=UPI003743E596